MLGEDGSFNALVEAHEKAWSIFETNRFSMRFPDGQYSLGVFAKVSPCELEHSASAAC